MSLKKGDVVIYTLRKVPIYLGIVTNIQNKSGYVDVKWFGKRFAREGYQLNNDIKLFCTNSKLIELIYD